MITYLTIGTKDLAKSIQFFDILLADLSAQRLYQTDTLAAWQFAQGGPLLMVTYPYDGQAASVGNGNMVALAVDSPEQVDVLHRQALTLGASDAGAPGFRGKRFYGAYFRDPDGNKFNFHCNI